MNRITFCHAVCMAFCILCIGLSACTKIELEEHAIHTCAPMPKGVACATAFVAGDKAYVFGGRTQDGTYQNTLWEYNIAQNTWKALGETPLVPRVNAMACVVNDTVYLGLGYNGGKVYRDSAYLRDFWQFVPAYNTWTRLADYPNSETNKCISFTTDTDLYVGCGFYDHFSLDMFRYSRKNNTWIQMPHTPEYKIFALMGMCSGQVGNRYFVGTGYTTAGRNFWYEYNLTNGTYERRQPTPTKMRNCAASASTEEYVYVIGGQHFGGTETSQIIYDDILRYNPANDSWILCGNIPNGGTMNLITFAYQNRVYFGLGEDGDYKIKNNLYFIEE